MSDVQRSLLPDAEQCRCVYPDKCFCPPEARLHGKYHGLRRTRDDSLVEGWYFVIREGDESAAPALLAYADACEATAPELAADLRQVVREWALAQGLYDAGWER